MSAYFKRVVSIFGSVLFLFLFVGSTFNPFLNSHKKINHDKLVAYVLEEVSFEMTYGDKNIDIDSFVDNAVKDALRNN